MQVMMMKRLAEMEAVFTTRLNRATETMSLQTSHIKELTKKVSSLEASIRSGKTPTTPQAPQQDATTPKAPQKPQNPSKPSAEAKKTSKSAREAAATSATPTAPKSYSQAAQNPSKSWETVGPKHNKKKTTNAPLALPLSQRRFVIKRSPESTPLDPKHYITLRDKCNEILKAHMHHSRSTPTGNIIIGITHTAKGNLLATTCGEVKAESLMEIRQILAKRLAETNLDGYGPTGVTEVQDVREWPKIIIHRVDTSAFPDTTEGMIKLKGELENSQAWFRVVEDIVPRYLTSAARREREEVSLMSPRIHTSMVIACQSEDMASAAINQGLFAWGTKLKATRFHKSRPTDMCKRCLGFGHHEDSCRKAWSCIICADTHATVAHTCDICGAQGKECPCRPPFCHHCNSDHLATDPKCLATKAFRDRLRRPREQQGETTEASQHQHFQPSNQASGTNTTTHNA